MSGYVAPNDQDVALIENKLLTDPSLRPAFVHCQHGRDRTGVVIALHRVFREQPAWSPKQAYDEMLAYGFQTSLHELLNYYFEKTKWHP
jgi:protein tyrosine/serine phosphatase